MGHHEGEGSTDRHPALADVYRFTLPDSQGHYFVRLRYVYTASLCSITVVLFKAFDDRPGLRAFLTEIGKLYELHIYTMGTRNYAAAISRIIDPEQRIFRERVLSRDESGSTSHLSVFSIHSFIYLLWIPLTHLCRHDAEDDQAPVSLR